MPKRPTCPDCHKQLRVKALTDSDQRVWSKWRYCEECGWDERGKFEVTVWGDEGDIVKVLWEADQNEVDEIMEQYDDDPRYVVQVERKHQNELPA